MNTNAVNLREGRLVAIPKKISFKKDKNFRIIDIVISRGGIVCIAFITLFTLKVTNLQQFETLKTVLIQKFYLHKILEKRLLDLYNHSLSFQMTKKHEFLKDQLDVTSSNTEWKLDYKNQDDTFYDENKFKKYNEMASSWNFNPSEHKRKKIRLPANGFISSLFGMRIHPVRKKQEFHKGIDIAANMKSPIVAAHDGKILEAGFEKTYGNYIKLEGKENIVTLYAHCAELKVFKNQYVKEGEIIAKVGDTGSSSGPHLHFEVYKEGKLMDPMIWLTNKN